MLLSKSSKVYLQTVSRSVRVKLSPHLLSRDAVPPSNDKLSGVSAVNAISLHSSGLGAEIARVPLALIRVNVWHHVVCYHTTTC